jgi:ABC-type polysaccharide/polyol phosphate transport system ATPase subunit
VSARPQTGEAGSVVVAEDVAKTFRLPHERKHTLKERVLHPRRQTRYEDLQALDGVSFEVRGGEFFGVVGRNGSGKSTLLKCLAGIYRVDRGELAVAGRVSPFIELGVGFNPDLSARDNVVINGVMLGLTPHEARRHFDEIIEFAELEEFVDLKLKNYSSGMHVRLAFAVMVQVEADILLIDEVLAVGDAAFQQKCFDSFREMREAGRTILFVTHSMSQIERFCDRAMLLERGQLVSIGDAADVAMHYNELNFGRGAALDEIEPAEQRPGDQSAAIVRAWFENAAGETVDALAQGDTCRIVIEFEARETVRDPVVALDLLNDGDLKVFATNSNWTSRPTGTFRPGERGRLVVTLDMNFGPGRYRLLVTLMRPGEGGELIDRRARFQSLLLHGVRVGGGLLEPPHEVEFERGTAQVEATAG